MKLKGQISTLKQKPINLTRNIHEKHFNGKPHHLTNVSREEVLCRKVEGFNTIKAENGV